MGNICSRSANKPDPFAQPGRPLGSSAPSQHHHNNDVPAGHLPKQKGHFASPGRTLGGGEEAGTGMDARARAALAAQKRADVANTASKGKLGNKLAAQKSQTHAQTLSEVSRDERAARDADGAAEARRWQ